MSVIFLSIGIFLLWGGWEAFLDYTRTKDYLGYSTGQVVKKHFTRASDGNTLYYIDYFFTSAGKEKIRTTGTIHKQFWDMLKENDRLEVRYNPADPERNFPAESGGASLIYALFIFLLGMVFSLFGITNFLRSFKKRKIRK